jgi:biopolymer transport protein ExbB/TolQ
MLEHTLASYASAGATAVLWVLVALSVLSIAIAAERVLGRWRDRTNPALLADLEASDARWVPETLASLLQAGGQEARVLEAGLLAGDEGGPAAAEEALTAGLVRMRLGLSAHLTVLGTIGSNAPFIGLFGTVLGILRAFGDLSLDADGGAEAVMAGISEALVATAIGLAVAIPAVVLYNLLTRRNEAIVERTAALGHQIVQQLHRGRA